MERGGLEPRGFTQLTFTHVVESERTERNMICRILCRDLCGDRKRKLTGSFPGKRVYHGLAIGFGVCLV